MQEESQTLSLVCDVSKVSNLSIWTSLNKFEHAWTSLNSFERVWMSLNEFEQVESNIFEQV